MTKEITCCFTGHRTLPVKDKRILLDRLCREILRLRREKGVTRFIAGGALGFDTLAAKAVLYLKKEDPSLTLHLILPCKDQASRWNPRAVTEYNRILSQADSVTCLYDSYRTGCMQERNRRMADESRYCIAYLTKNSGGTKYTVDYCRKNGVEVLNLGEGQERSAAQRRFEDYFGEKPLW